MRKNKKNRMEGNGDCYLNVLNIFDRREKFRPLPSFPFIWLIYIMPCKAVPCNYGQNSLCSSRCSGKERPQTLQGCHKFCKIEKNPFKKLCSSTSIPTSNSFRLSALYFLTLFRKIPFKTTLSLLPFRKSAVLGFVFFLTL